MKDTDKGLIVSIYKNPLGDCTLGGVSATADDALLLCPEGWMMVADSKDRRPTLKLDHRPELGRRGLRAIPADTEGMWAFGGNFIHTSDSRFSDLNNGFPIPIHDRDMLKERRYART